MVNATDSIFSINKEHTQVERVVQVIYHNILRDYIAEANRREVMTNLYNFLRDENIAIISKMDLKKYQELESAILATDMLKVNKD